MKALSICQPYASLILLPQNHPEHKRIENRCWNWMPAWNEDFAIHASKGRKMLVVDEHGVDVTSGLSVDGMAFGALVGVAKLAGAFRLRPPLNALPLESLAKWPWIQQHKHVEGPVCLVLSEIRRFREPIKYFGQLGFFEVSEEVIAGGELVPVDVL